MGEVKMGWIDVNQSEVDLPDEHWNDILLHPLNFQLLLHQQKYFYGKYLIAYLVKYLMHVLNKKCTHLECVQNALCFSYLTMFTNF